MSWTFTDDVEQYAKQVDPLLSERAVECTLPLSIVAGARSGRFWPAGSFGAWYSQGDTVSGAVLQTPPYELVLAVVPGPAVESLVAALRQRGPDLPGVHGDQADVERFVDGYLKDTRLRSVVAMRLRLYQLAELTPPKPGPNGRSRRATLADLDLVRRWTSEFLVESGLPASGAEDSLADDGLLLWEDTDPVTGHLVPVSMAGCRPPVAGVSRVGPVYTPAPYRNRGYGAAVTAAISAESLRSGARQVVLFTDLANPVSNSIYQRIGYRPVSDRQIVRFEP